MSQRLTRENMQSLFDELKRLKTTSTNVRFNWRNFNRKSGIFDVTTQEVAVYWRTGPDEKSIIVKLGPFELALPITSPGYIPCTKDDIVIRYSTETDAIHFHFQDIKGDREQILQFS